MIKEVQICITFSPFKSEILLDFEKIIDYISSKYDYELMSKESHRMDFSSKDRRKEILIHSDGMVDFYIKLDEFKNGLPNFINEGYDVIKNLKEVDIKCRKQIGLIFSGINSSNIYKEDEQILRELIQKKSGPVKVNEYITDSFSRIDYIPSDLI